MTRRPQVPGLSDEWADKQLDVLDVLREAMDAVEATPYQPDPPVCRHCTHVADTPGGPVFSCQSSPGCLLDQLGPEKTRARA